MRLFERVEQACKAGRDQVKNVLRVESVWWQYAERAIGLYTEIRRLPRCFVAARTTKHLNFYCLYHLTIVFTDALKVFTTDRWDLYTVVQSTIHEVWARKYSGALKQDLRYSPSECFDTFPFPEDMADSESYAGGHRRALS